MKLEKIKGYVAETDTGTLFGPFRTAQQAADWLRWDDSERNGSSCSPCLSGKVRMLIPPTD
jgi:hypothetical protein